MTATMLHIILVGTLAAHCSCEDAPACNANDSGDDTCQFLQGPVGIAVIGRGADTHATATKRNDVQDESVPPIAQDEAVKEDHVLVTKHSDVQAKSGEHDEGAEEEAAEGDEEPGEEEEEAIEGGDEAVEGGEEAVEDAEEGEEAVEGWPGDLFKKFKDFFHAGMHLEKEFKDMDEEWNKFERFVKTTMRALVFDGKGTSLADEQKKVKTALMEVSVAAGKVVKSLAKARKTYKNGMGKVLPEKVSSLFLSIFRNAEKDSAKFSKAFQDAAEKIGAANTTAICAKCAGALGGIEKRAQRFVESALGMTIKDFRKEADKLLAKLPKQAQKEVDKFLKQATEAGQRMVDSLPTVVKEVRDGVAKVFRAECPDLNKKSGAERSVSLSALLLGIAMWLA